MQETEKKLKEFEDRIQGTKEINCIYDVEDGAQ